MLTKSELTHYALGAWCNEMKHTVHDSIAGAI